jgi:hypothetical protein
LRLVLWSSSFFPTSTAAIHHKAEALSKPHGHHETRYRTSIHKNGMAKRSSSLEALLESKYTVLWHASFTPSSLWRMYTRPAITLYSAQVPLETKTHGTLSATPCRQTLRSYTMLFRDVALTSSDRPRLPRLIRAQTNLALRSRLPFHSQSALN